MSSFDSSVVRLDGLDSLVNNCKVQVSGGSREDRLRLIYIPDVRYAVVSTTWVLTIVVGTFSMMRLVLVWMTVTGFPLTVLTTVTGQYEVEVW